MLKRKLRLLILADDCNPEWPSLPIVGYKYACALAKVTDATIVTQIRNRENIEKTGELSDRVIYIDTEWIAAGMAKLSTILRGGSEVAWSTNQIMSYLPYVAFERQALRHFRPSLKAGEFDVVHRITPMTPTLPSYFAGRTRQPFILGPLNGNLDWPKMFAVEQRREREGLRRLRNFYKYLPYARSTYRRSNCVLAAFQHTVDDLTTTDPRRIISVPEIGFDPDLFYPGNRQTPFVGTRPKRFLLVGRLVPYKLPEVVVRAFVSSEVLEPHTLRIIGSGPERQRLERIVKDAGAEKRITFEGTKTQAEVAEAMRQCDAFVFPSIRELGAGVVIEAMAAGITVIATNYGAPSYLTRNGRGLQVKLQPLDGLVNDYRVAMEHCLKNPEFAASCANKARHYAKTLYTWDAKARYTVDIYDALITKKSLEGFTDYR